MAVQTAHTSSQPLRRGLREARRLLWMQLAIRTLLLSVSASMGFALLAALLTAWQAPEGARAGLWAAAAVAPLAGVAAAILMRPSIARAARAVDYRLDLNQQLGTAEELLRREAAGDLVSLQIATAVALAERLEVERAFPLLPRRELVTAILLAALTGSVLFLVSLGLVLPNPFSGLQLPSFSRDSPAAQYEMLGVRDQRTLPGARSPAMEPVRQSLEDIRRQVGAGSLSGALASALLGQANAELNRIASESRARQEALEGLANELRRTAAGREAADSLRQGDVETAAQQLQELGRKSDQLSDAAKQELARALNRAAAQSEQARSLARSESAAAEALAEGSYPEVVESMDELAEALRDTAAQIVPQSEIADVWQQMEELAQQMGDSGALEDPASALSRPVAQGADGAQERNRQARGEQAASATGTELAEGQGQQSSGRPAGSRGEPGNAPGGPALREEKSSLGGEGNRLDVEGKVGDRFPPGGGPSSEPPAVLREGTGNTGASLPSQAVEGRTAVPAERLSVPGEHRSTIRDYFSR